MMRFVWIVLFLLLGALYLVYLLLTNWMDTGTAAAIVAVLFVAMMWYVVARIRRALAAGGSYLSDILRGGRR